MSGALNEVVFLAMSFRMTASEDALFKLEGRSIDEVGYVELEGRGDASRSNSSVNAIESLDYGFEWKLDTGARCSFIWAWEFAKQKVSFSHAPLGPFGKRWDVTERWRERGLIKTRIVTVEVEWCPAFDLETPPYPQSVFIRFESGAAILVSAHDSEGNAERHLLTTFFFDAAPRR